MGVDPCFGDVEVVEFCADPAICDGRWKCIEADGGDPGLNWNFPPTASALVTSTVNCSNGRIRGVPTHPVTADPTRRRESRRSHITDNDPLRRREPFGGGVIDATPTAT
uniref:hypothetical protein n=1 Tax=Rhodococcus erythropolis TaxID=1833 RepID=UPI00209C4408|nr:hypothetical protein [Rhodococcus erythropolis]